MTELQFKAGIRQARAMIKRAPTCYGVCNSLWSAFDGNTIRYGTDNTIGCLFGEMFSPEKSMRAYWLGALVRHNTQKRLDYLEFFCQYVIVNEYYLAY